MRCKLAAMRLTEASGSSPSIEGGHVGIHVVYPGTLSARIDGEKAAVRTSNCMADFDQSTTSSPLGTSGKAVSQACSRRLRYQTRQLAVRRRAAQDGMPDLS